MSLAGVAGTPAATAAVGGGIGREAEEPPNMAKPVMVIITNDIRAPMAPVITPAAAMPVPPRLLICEITPSITPAVPSSSPTNPMGNKQIGQLTRETIPQIMDATARPTGGLGALGREYP